MKTFVFLITTLVLNVLSSQAQDFVYRPTNPAFGGDTFNYQWLLSSATAQNGFEDPDAALGRQERDPLEDFQQDLNRRLLSDLSRSLVGDQFGEEGLEEGVFEVGIFQIEVFEGADGVSITILDTSTGDQTTVTVPEF
ncbi:curli production assembly/transport component CsgF [Tunicatimonas pelagia]|uniref:curli production assembly/transport component CsgF n=1 Tax=Tunicatimonas pelagia TaxID=931531 RepID=UPI002666482C|nr:curli production assembly/transport component CsgF [Tunicatimonas pelagia]WKN43199.1 curli assembly protein CsgF [Tunicatimonas pelagia]